MDPEILYSLLAFAPTFSMADLPRTSAAETEACARVARGVGLLKVKVGNLHLPT